MAERVRRFLDIRPGEGWSVAYTFLFIALAVASFTLAKPIRQGVFLKEFGAYKLAYAYVAVPLVLACFVPIYQFFSRRLGQRLVFTSTFLFFSSNVLLFWCGFHFHRVPRLAGLFFVWVNCYGRRAGAGVDLRQLGLRHAAGQAPVRARRRGRVLRRDHRRGAGAHAGGPAAAPSTCCWCWRRIVSAAASAGQPRVARAPDRTPRADGAPEHASRSRAPCGRSGARPTCGSSPRSCSWWPS